MALLQAPSFVAAAAAASLLAAAMVQGVMHQREAADQQQQLSQLAAQKAEALRRQKAVSAVSCLVGRLCQWAANTKPQ